MGKLVVEQACHTQIYDVHEKSANRFIMGPVLLDSPERSFRRRPKSHEGAEGVVHWGTEERNKERNKETKKLFDGSNVTLFIHIFSHMWTQSEN